MWLWWCLHFAWTEAQAEVVDRVVAVVDGEPILASDLRLIEALRSVDPSPVPFWSARREPLELAIDVVLIRHLAADVALYTPSREAVTERILALRQAFEQEDSAGSSAAERWQRFLEVHGLEEAGQLEAVARRRLVVERFLLRNVQASPQDPAAWLTECQRLLEQLHRRPLKIRQVPAEPAP